MEADPPLLHSTQQAEAVTPDSSIRQRQRDRLAPRGRIPVESSNPSSSMAAAPDGLRYKPRLSPVKAKQGVSPQRSEQRRRWDEMRDANPAARMAKDTHGDVKVNHTPESTSAGREGRHFAVANVGNNGKIYLR